MISGNPAKKNSKPRITKKVDTGVLVTILSFLRPHQLRRRERGEITYHGLVDGVAGHEAQEGADDDDGEADVRPGGDQGVEGHGLLERLVVDDQDGDGQRL